MHGPYSQKSERFSWNDLKRQGVVNLDGRPSIGLYSYVSTLSLPPGSTPTVTRDPLSGVQVLAHLTSVPTPEPLLRKLTPKRLEGFEISAVVYDFMQYSLYYMSMRQKRTRQYMRKYFPNNPCTHFKSKFIRRLPKELHYKKSADKMDSTYDEDENSLSHDQLMQHLENLEKQEQNLNGNLKSFTMKTASKVGAKRNLEDSEEMDDDTEFDDKDDEPMEEEEDDHENKTANKGEKKTPLANNKQDSDSSDESTDEEDDDKDSEMGTMDDDDYYGLYSGNESRDGYGSDDDGAFYE